ncbi:MAG: efflux transporter outer membrane subunit [Cyclonatronaceae bacterium]
MKLPYTTWLVCFIPVLLWAAGCKTQESVSPPVTLPESFSESGTALLPEKWWQSFDDDELNTAVASGLESNFTLLSAWQRLNAARALADQAGAARFPTLEASAQGQTSRDNNDVTRDREQFELGLTSVYELDLWGRIRSSAQAEAFRAQASLYDYQTAALTLTAEITRAWYQLADARAQLSLLEEQTETNETVLELLRNRFRIGQIERVDVVRQQQLVEATREQRIAAASRAATLEHRLAVLLGEPPQNGPEMLPSALPGLPALPETGIPAALVERRPDVQRAFFLLQAADRELASAISNRYPRLTITASATTAADNAQNLFQNWAASFAGNLLAPVFNGGRLKAEVRENESIKNQRLYEYAQSVLTAFEEVENALIREQNQRQRIESLEQQITLANEAYAQLRLQYLNGDGNYLDVLTALDGIQQLRRDLLSARLERVEFRIALYRALAGPIQTDMMAES